MIKSLESKEPEDSRLTGIHVEMMAEKIFREYGRSNKNATKEDLLKQYYKEAPKMVLKKMEDPTGQSSAIDKDLGPSNDILRHEISDRMKDTARSISTDEGIRGLLDVERQR